MPRGPKAPGALQLEFPAEVSRLAVQNDICTPAARAENSPLYNWPQRQRVGQSSVKSKTRVASGHPIQDLPSFLPPCPVPHSKWEVSNSGNKFLFQVWASQAGGSGATAISEAGKWRPGWFQLPCPGLSNPAYSWCLFLAGRQHGHLAQTQGKMGERVPFLVLWGGVCSLESPSRDFSVPLQPRVYQKGDMAGTLFSPPSTEAGL